MLNSDGCFDSYSNFFKLGIISMNMNQEVESKWLLASSSMLTPAAVNVPILSKYCLRSYCNLQNPEYNSLIWNGPFSIDSMKGMPP